VHEITRDDRVGELSSFPQRICDFMTRWSEDSPDRPALVEGSGTWTYRQLASVVSDTEPWLLELGMRPGDRVMIVCENCRALVAVLLALARLDAWPVLVNARMSAREVDEIRDRPWLPSSTGSLTKSPHLRCGEQNHNRFIS
jgi:long-chain acyl-CoA synthetase